MLPGAPPTGLGLPRWAQLMIVPVVLIAAWEALAQLGWINLIFFPAPSQIAISACKMIASGELLRHFADSLRRIAIANTVAIGIGVPLGFFMGLYRPFENLMDGIVNLVRPIPPLAWIPLAILWFGVGEKAVVFITSISAFFAILLNTIAGVRAVEKSLVRAALSLGATESVLIRKVILPATLPHLFTGFRIALGVSWMSIVAAELIAASSGLGFMISYYREVIRTDLILVGMLSIGVVGFLMDRGLIWLEGKLLPWRVRLEL
ncbi:MAG: ABC transporter permease [Alphaproteobacteria bacterium]|nr:ABC transporter permease [Alphaproteobacteria bacterium]